MTMKRLRADSLGVTLTTAALLTTLLAVTAALLALAQRTDNLKGAGIRSSTYGRPNDPGPSSACGLGREDGLVHALPGRG